MSCVKQFKEFPFWEERRSLSFARCFPSLYHEFAAMCLHPFLFILVWWLCPDLLSAALMGWQERGASWPSPHYVIPVWFSLWAKRKAGYLDVVHFSVVCRGGKGRRELSGSRARALLEYLCAALRRFWLLSCRKLLSPDWGSREGQWTPFTRQGDNSGFGSIFQAGVLLWRCHQPSQLHGSCRLLPPFLPSTLFNTAASKGENIGHDSHLFPFRFRSAEDNAQDCPFLGTEDRVGSRDVLSHSLLLQNLLYLSLDAKFEGYCVDCWK